eukprot:GHVU01154383.1.p1 GENE.GHVU01154383.1~~GHVU01154383.1.p1  ORF type:complete len:235 (+),score=4.02 GHVU01154383.1:503-1207(+)
MVQALAAGEDCSAPCIHIANACATTAFECLSDKLSLIPNHVEAVFACFSSAGTMSTSCTSVGAVESLCMDLRLGAKSSAENVRDNPSLMSSFIIPCRTATHASFCLGTHGEEEQPPSSGLLTGLHRRLPVSVSAAHNVTAAKKHFYVEPPLDGVPKCKPVSNPGPPGTFARLGAVGPIWSRWGTHWVSHPKQVSVASAGDVHPSRTRAAPGNTNMGDTLGGRLKRRRGEWERRL